VPRGRPLKGGTGGPNARDGQRPLLADAHAHPGRCFLRGLPADDPAAALLGGDTSDRAIDEIRASGVGLVAFATVADLRVLRPDPVVGIRAHRPFEPGEARADHDRQLRALAELTAREDVTPVLGSGDVRRARAGNTLGLLLACEGGDFLEGRIDGVEEAYAAGARSITLVHYRVNELGDIQTEPPMHGGLTPFGAEVVREMNRLGMIVDLAHATFEVTRDVLAVSDAPVMISHSHLASPGREHPRLLEREHALAVTRSGGLVGAWPAGAALASFDDYVEEILRMVEVLGVEHVAIGTDMDANYRPVLSHYGELPTLAEALRDRGLGPEETALVMGGNLARLVGEVLR